MPMDFIDQAKLGNNQWWRYFLSILLVVLGGLFMNIVLGFAIGIWIALDNNPNTGIDSSTSMILGLDPFVHYILLAMTVIGGMLGLLAAVRFIHKRRILSLVTPSQQINWKRVGLGFGLFLGLISVSSAVEYLFAAGEFGLTQNPGRMLALAPVVLILTPLETTSQELLFRGYLLQAMGLFTRRISLLSTMSALIFTAVHLRNPEMALAPLTMTAYYFFVGFFLALVTLRTNSLELAIGIHAAVNLFAALVVNYSESVLRTESLFFVTKWDPAFALGSFIFLAGVFWVILRLHDKGAWTTDPDVEP